jgi:hypothetical protein
MIPMGAACAGVCKADSGTRTVSKYRDKRIQAFERQLFCMSPHRAASFCRQVVPVNFAISGPYRGSSSLTLLPYVKNLSPSFQPSNFAPFAPSVCHRHPSSVLAIRYSLLTIRRCRLARFMQLFWA